MDIVGGSMHQCLNVPEILLIICGGMYTNTPEDDSPSDKALASLARTCRSFTVPAVTYLWSVQRALTPLIRCMPSDLWVEESDSKLTFRRAVLETDWERYDFYAAKILQLGAPWQENVSCLRTRDPNPSVYMSLAAYRPAKSLLPNLRFFWCTERISRLLPAIQGFIGDKLVKIIVDHNDMYNKGAITHPINTIDLDPLFSALPRLSPYVHTLQLMVQDKIIVSPLAFDALKKLQCITDFRTDIEVPTLVLNHLAGLSTLVLFGEVALSPSNIQQFVNLRDQFPSLKHVCFSLTGLAMTTCIFIPQRKFLRLLCTFHDCFGSQHEVALFIASLHRHPCRTSLIGFALQLRYRRSPPSTPLLTTEILRPLLSFSALERLNIWPIAPDDVWIREIAQALPNLNEVSLCGGSDVRPKVTLDGIIPLVRFCPKLKYLRIILNAYAVRPAELDGIQNNNITTITLDQSTIVHPKKVFRALIRMFPHLTTVASCGAGNLYTPAERLSYKTGWDEVNYLLKETY